MFYKRYASEFMSSPVIVAGKENSFNQLLEFFITYKIQHLPIEENGQIIGIISVNDMLRYIYEKMSGEKQLNAEMINNDFRVEEIMTANPICADPTTSQKKILDILSAGKFQAVPVVDHGVIKGIITNKDIARIYNYDLTHIL